MGPCRLRVVATFGMVRAQIAGIIRQIIVILPPLALPHHAITTFAPAERLRWTQHELFLRNFGATMYGLIVVVS